MNKLAIFVITPFVLAFPPLVGALIGHFLDRYFHSDPWLLYIFIALGLVAGFREFYHLIKRFGDEI